MDCLGVLKGRVRRFPDGTGDKIPQIGWNDVSRTERGECAADFAGREFYFVHSYYAEVVPETALVTGYAGVDFTAMVRKGALWACQFHPEKSGRVGLDLLRAWLDVCRR